MYPLPKKLQIIENLSKPKTPKEVRKRLGLTCYYHKLIPAYADLIILLRQLTCKTVLFIWTHQCQKTFKLCKEAHMKSHFWFIQVAKTIYLVHLFLKVYLVCSANTGTNPFP